jgi:hypothetical protein
MSDELARPARPTGTPGYTAAGPAGYTAASGTAASPAGYTAASGTADDKAASDTTWPSALSTAVRPAAPSTRRPGGRRYRASQARGRRYRPERPAVPSAPPAQQRPWVEISSFPSLASASMALARMFAVSLAGCLLAAWLHIALIAGLGFCAGCVLATRYARRQAQLPVVLSMPVTFLAALVFAELVIPGGGSGHRTVLSVFEGTVLTLAAVAPLLFAGTAVGLGIALFRGLPQCIRELRTEVHRHDRGAGRRG